MRQHRRVVAGVAVCALLVTACGSRLTEEQREFAIAAATGGGDAPADLDPVGELAGEAGGAQVDADLEPGAEPGEGAAVPGEPAAAPGEAAPEAGGDTGGGGAGESGGGGDTPADTRAAPPGGNGGATDTGVTEDQIVLANVADISGPVPGIFEDAQKAAAAYVAYFTASEGTIYGRQLRFLPLDSRLDSGQNRQQYLRACDEAFAAIGSMSAFEEGAADPVQNCGIPDVRTVTTSEPMQRVPNAYSGEVQTIGWVNGSAFRHWADQHPRAVEKAAYLWIENATTNFQTGQNRAALRTIGYEWVYERAIQVAESNYAAFVLDMKNRGVEFVTFQGDYTQAVRLAEAMDQQNFEPTVYALQPNVYHSRFLAAGPAVEGAEIYMSSIPLEEIGNSEELQLYRQWLKQVDPRAEPTYLGMYAWSVSRLVVEGLKAIGPNATREALIDYLDEVSGWDGNGLHAPQEIGAKVNTDCHLIVQVQGGTFVRTFPDRAWSCQDSALRVP